MIYGVVEQWLTALQPLQEQQLLTAVYGLVRPGRIRVEQGRDFVAPVLIDAPDVQDCDKLEDGLLINDRQRAVIFVEGAQTRSEKNGNALIEILPVTVVLWLDESKFEPLASGRALTGLTALVTAELEKPQTGRYSGFQNITFVHTGFTEGWRVFQKYTFREETGYLLAPYRSVGIEGNLKFYLDGKANCNQIDLRPIAGNGSC